MADLPLPSRRAAPARFADGRPADVGAHGRSGSIARGSGDVAGSIRCFEMAQVGLRAGRACYRFTAHTISINRAAVMT